MCTRQNAITHLQGHTYVFNFYDKTLSTEKQRHHVVIVIISNKGDVGWVGSGVGAGETYLSCFHKKRSKSGVGHLAATIIHVICIAFHNYT